MNFKEMLQQPTIVYRDEIISQTKQMVNEIIENDQQNGRSVEHMTKNVISGVILETAFAKATGGIINRRKFNSKEPRTFAYDVSIDDINFEIKPSSKFDEWFNFNLKGYENFSEETLVRAELTTFLNYRKWVDWVVVGFYETIKENESWEVNWKWVCDAETFDLYIRRSNPNRRGPGTTHFYHQKEAINKGACIVI